MTFNTPAEREDFIKNNLPLVASRVRKRNMKKFNEDLFQEGVVGLIKSIENFDENRGIKFSTYAAPRIDERILHYKRYDSTIRPYRERKNSKCHYIKTINIDDIMNVCYYQQNYESDEDVIKEFLKGLSGRSKLIFELFLKGFTQKNISEVIGTHRTYVSKLISKEIKKFQENYFE